MEGKPSAPEPGNWGRWGDADERGAANLLDPEKVLEAARLVRTGRTWNLGLTVPDASRFAARGRAPAQHFMGLDGGDYAAGVKLPGDAHYAEDHLVMSLHGTTHVDALSHFWAGDSLYNGHSPDRIRSYGATRLGIEKLGGAVGRGVLLDIPALAGVDCLDPGAEVTPAQIEAALEAAGLELRAGDSVLIRTGWQRMLDRDADAYHSCSPGIGLAAGRALAAADVFMVASDTIVTEFRGTDGRYDEGSVAPIVHPLLLRDHGIYIGELFALEELAAAAVHEFMLVLAPLNVGGGTAGPMNPIAIA
jgi:kynurenine formamidase